jgi:glycerol-3-phosphate acyltransferase PlsY
MVLKILFAVLSYLSGAVPYGYILVKFKGYDIRNVGSGNIGATNVFRFNKTLGIITLILDFLKAFIPTVLALKFFSFGFASIVALLTVLGHITTPFLKFKGGKGVASTIGAFVALIPLPTIIGIVVFIIMVMIFKMVSLGSLTGIFTITVISVIFMNNPLYFDVAMIFVCIAVFWAHKENVKRIIRGPERKVNFK